MFLYTFISVDALINSNGGDFRPLTLQSSANAANTSTTAIHSVTSVVMVLAAVFSVIYAAAISI